MENEVTISAEEYTELLSGKKFKSENEQKLKDLEKFKLDHTEPDTDEQVRAYLDEQRKKEVAQQERAKKLQSTFM